MTDKQADLYAALSAAQGAFGHMEKSGRNDFARYDYVPSDVIIAHAAPVMKAHGLAVIPTSSTFVPTPDSKKTAGVYRAGWKLVHKGGGEVDMARCLPIPIDKKPTDKLVLGANSELLGYLYRDLFSINRGIGTDVSGRDDAPAPPEPEPFHPMKTGQQAKIRGIIGDLADALKRDIPDFDAKAFDTASKILRRPITSWCEMSDADAARVHLALDNILAKARKETAA